VRGPLRKQDARDKRQDFRSCFLPLASYLVIGIGNVI
jgi:hypothetical protein